MSKTVTNGTADEVREAILLESNLASEGVVILKGKFTLGGENIKVEALKHSLTIRADAEDIKTGNKPVIDEGGGTEIATDGSKLARPVFDINAPGQKVTIQDLHFTNTSVMAIRVQAVKDLLIARCVIDKIMPMDVTQILSPTLKADVSIAGGIAVAENAAGDITIQDNVIDVGGANTDRTFGIQILHKSASPKATIHITGNIVMNTTAHGVVLRDINGSATIEGKNRITTGQTGGQNLTLLDKLVDGIMCQGAGTYIVRNNVIDCGYENSAGIRLQSISTSIPITLAQVVGNEISMSLPANKVPGSESAGIELRRDCLNNTVSGNKLLGAANAALSVVADTSPLDNKISLIPDNNKLLNNVRAGFIASLADYLVGANVTNTQISSSEGKQLDIVASNIICGTIADFGTGTKILAGNFEFAA